MKVIKLIAFLLAASWLLGACAMEEAQPDERNDLPVAIEDNSPRN